MTATNNNDPQFDENLSALARRVDPPNGAPADLRSRCAGILTQEKETLMARAYRIVRRPGLISTLGAAATIALLVGFFYRPQGEPQVEAAVILKTLNTQIQSDPLLEVTLDSLSIEEVFVNGHLQVSNRGIAGDIQVEVDEGGDGDKIELDVSIGISEEEGWVLVRKLKIPDPEAMAMLAFFMPPGTETLVKLPTEELQLALGDKLEPLERLQEITDFVQELIDSADDVGATVIDQPDGTVLLTLPIKDASTLRALARIKILSEDDRSDDEAEITRKLAREIDDDDGEELFGTTIEVIYDPTAKAVRSLTIGNLGATHGSVSIKIREGEIDPDLLDSSRVIGPDTRVLDIDALKKTIEAFEGKKKRRR